MADEIVRSDELADYLESHHLRVVRGSWRRGQRWPILVLGPAQSEATSAAAADAQPTAEPERKELDE